MKPRRTHFSDFTFSLPGGTEDSDLWVIRDQDAAGHPILRSTWVPTDAERKAIARGHNIELIVWGTGHPPVNMDVVDYPLGKAPASTSSEEGNI
jgi:hypothetical protein